MTSFKRIAALVRLNRYGHRLSPGALAYGESSAPTANVYRWAAAGADPNVRQLGALVSRVGPGTGGDAAFSALDPQLERPYVNELTFGFEVAPERSHDRPDDGDRPARGPARRRGQYRRSDIRLMCRSPCWMPGVDHAGGQNRYRVQPAGCRLRRGSLSADEPGRASRHVCRRRHHPANDDGPIVPDRRRHGGASGRDVGEPRLPGIRERSRAHRRGVHGSERGDQRARAPVHRARLHDQDGRRVSFLGRSPARHLGSLSGRPALRASGHRAGAQSGGGSDSGVRERQDAVYLHDDHRCATAESVHGWTAAA